MHKIFDEQAVADLSKSSRLSDRAYNCIRRAIIRRRFEPGQWLRQEDLADELNVSRTTIRAALTRLAAEGLVEQVPYKGFRAISISADEVEEIFTLRAKLESWAFELAAAQLSDDDLAKMRDLLPKAVLDPELEQYDETRQANREFHWTAIRASQRPHLIRMLEHIWDLIPSDFAYTELPKSERQRIAEAEGALHADILACLEAGDGERAAKMVEEHILGTVDYTRRALAEASD
jgi:DNA-binding GntR family transcriptional regulator